VLSRVPRSVCSPGGIRYTVSFVLRANYAAGVGARRALPAPAPCAQVTGRAYRLAHLPRKLFSAGTRWQMRNELYPLLSWQVSFEFLGYNAPPVPGWSRRPVTARRRPRHSVARYASSACRNLERPRCRITRWLASETCSRLHTSWDVYPCTSRKVTTSRCAGGNASIAARMTPRVSFESSRSSAAPQATGNDTQPPGEADFAPRKRSGLTAGSNGSSARLHTAENGTLRRSRRACVLAQLTTMPKSHVLKVERASKRCRPRNTTNQAS
jgi:hypothetical protein